MARVLGDVRSGSTYAGSWRFCVTFGSARCASPLSDALVSRPRRFPRLVPPQRISAHVVLHRVLPCRSIGATNLSVLRRRIDHLGSLHIREAIPSAAASNPLSSILPIGLRLIFASGGLSIGAPVL